ncbi:uncharacterized protein HD556DRAFT_1309762 [Suillus plorans]|uniref:Uncharacterized protein n=1 Tax=Suillus plorans TaxID=116603 RepID=A0A9P7AN41_9AGAM|nr:uncharacterized protein HD556DRAFT_1309762 [Suillus plorans]KAG1791697.1 hypothetical protein HD556DRAFT_1309762 [Suillus plorans]
MHSLISHILDESKFQLLYDSFVKGPYIGEAVDGFYAYLRSNNIKFSRDYYAKFCSIVQSSGTAIFQTLQQDLSDRLPAQRSGNPDAVIKVWNDAMCDMHSEARIKFFNIVNSHYEVTDGTILKLNPDS